MWWPSDPIEAKLDHITVLLNIIIKKETTIMTALSDLQASQAALSAAVSAAVADIQKLAAALASATAGTADADVEAVVTQLNALAANLQAAVGPATS